MYVCMYVCMYVLSYPKCTTINSQTGTNVKKKKNSKTSIKAVGDTAEHLSKYFEAGNETKLRAINFSENSL